MNEETTAVAPLCEEEGCEWEGTPCFYPDNPIYGWEPKSEGEEPVFEPDHYLCAKHAYRAGFCFGCGAFWGGVESFDFDNPSHLCENCRTEVDDEQEDYDMDRVYSTYPFDAEEDWHDWRNE